MTLTGRTFGDIHCELFLAAMSHDAVALHVRAAEDALRRPDAMQTSSPYTIATPIVIASMYALALRSGPRTQWVGFHPKLTLEQILTMIWALDATEAALLGMGGYLTDQRRRSLLIDPDAELHLLAERSIEVALALGWDPARSRFDPRLLIPPALGAAQRDAA